MKGDDWKPFTKGVHSLSTWLKPEEVMVKLKSTSKEKKKYEVIVHYYKVRMRALLVLIFKI